MSVNYPISPHLADYAQSINQAKLGFTAKKNQAVHVVMAYFEQLSFATSRESVAAEDRVYLC